MPPADVGPDASQRERPSACPGCGLALAPRATGGPRVCPNCGYRDAFVDGKPGERTHDTAGSDRRLRLTITSGFPLGVGGSRADQGRWIRVRRAN